MYRINAILKKKVYVLHRYYGLLYSFHSLCTSRSKILDAGCTYSVYTYMHAAALPVQAVLHVDEYGRVESVVQSVLEPTRFNADPLTRESVTRHSTDHCWSHRRGAALPERQWGGGAVEMLCCRCGLSILFFLLFLIKKAI